MAEFVSREHFDEYTKRMDERFDHVVGRTDERFYSLEKRMEEGFAHVGQRFDGLDRRMDQLHADMLQMRNWLVWLFGLVVFGFIGSIVLILFRDVFR